MCIDKSSESAKTPLSCARPILLEKIVRVLDKLWHAGVIQLGKPPAMPGDSKRFDLCCGRVSGYCNDRSAFIPHFAKGGRGGICGR